MAKDLPYFKFYCSEWSDGDITLENFETQGLFINICAYYWSNECVVSYDKLLKKFRGSESIIAELINLQIIKLSDFNINISFLDEQLFEREVKSKKSSIAGKISAEKKKLAKSELKFNEKSTDVEITLNTSSTESQPIREEEIREDKKREYILNNSLLSEIKISDDKKFFLVKNLQFEITEEKLLHYKTALGFQKLFIKNLKEKKSPTSQTEKATYKNFVEPIRLIFEKKEATKEQLREAYEYLNSKEGEFWKSNILSTKKLREKLSMMILKKNTKVIDLHKKEISVPNPNQRKRIT
jgi:hypothetical protein